MGPKLNLMDPRESKEVEDRVVRLYVRYCQGFIHNDHKKYG